MRTVPELCFEGFFGAVPQFNGDGFDLMSEHHQLELHEVPLFISSEDYGRASTNTGQFRADTEDLLTVLLTMSIFRVLDSTICFNSTTLCRQMSVSGGSACKKPVVS